MQSLYYILIVAVIPPLPTWLSKLALISLIPCLGSEEKPEGTLQAEAGTKPKQNTWGCVTKEEEGNELQQPQVQQIKSPQLAWDCGLWGNYWLWKQVQIRVRPNLNLSWSHTAHNRSRDIPRNQFSSVAQSCPTLCNPMDCSMPGLPVHHQLLEFTQTHVHWVGDAIQPSHPLSSPSSLTFNLSQHQGLSQRVSSLHQVAKVLAFQLQHQSFQCIFRTDFL